MTPTRPVRLRQITSFGNRLVVVNGRGEGRSDMNRRILTSRSQAAVVRKCGSRRVTPQKSRAMRHSSRRSARATISGTFFAAS